MATNNPAQLYGCPAGDHCDAKLRAVQLARHVGHTHGVPIVTFGGEAAATAVIDLPPRQPLDGACLLLTRTDEQLPVWVRLHRFAETGDYLLAAMAQTNDTEAAKYYAEVRVGVAGKMLEHGLVAREMVSRCAVQSLQRKAWHRLLDEREGVLLSAESIRSTFDEVKLEAGISLTVDIRRV